MKAEKQGYSRSKRLRFLDHRSNGCHVFCTLQRRYRGVLWSNLLLRSIFSTIIRLFFISHWWFPFVQTLFSCSTFIQYLNLSSRYSVFFPSPLLSTWLYRSLPRRSNKAAACAHVSIFGAHSYKLDLQKICKTNYVDSGNGHTWRDFRLRRTFLIK